MCSSVLPRKNVEVSRQTEIQYILSYAKAKNPHSTIFSSHLGKN